MPRGTLIGTERIDRKDERTGVFVRQITSFPTISLHLAYETPTFAPDGKRMIFVSMRYPQRGAPYDLLTCMSDGKDIRQLSGDEPEGVSCCCLTTDGQHALYMERGTCHRTRLADAEDEVIGKLDGATKYDYCFGCRASDGRHYFPMVRTKNGVALVRWDLKTGEHVVVREADSMNHVYCNPGGPEITLNLFDRRPDGSLTGHTHRIHGDTLNELSLNFPGGPYGSAHACWLGRTGKYHGTQGWPGRAVQIMDRDGTVIEVANGPYFWHSGASYDGKWIVADTNWPNEGIWLLNVETRKKELLCLSKNSGGHPQYTHPHPNLSDDGGMAVFDSDATGITQVYVAYVADEVRERLSQS